MNERSTMCLALCVYVLLARGNMWNWPTSFISHSFFYYFADCSFKLKFPNPHVWNLMMYINMPPKRCLILVPWHNAESMWSILGITIKLVLVRWYFQTYDICIKKIRNFIVLLTVLTRISYYDNGFFASFWSLWRLVQHVKEKCRDSEMRLDYLSDLFLERA